MTTTREPIPPPIIGKAGRYTIFLTPPSTPKPSETTTTPKTHEQSPKNVAVLPPPVQPPPQHFGRPVSGSSKFGFLRDAAAKVKNAHSNLDEYIANWFGLNQSKYQWALDDYFETKAVVLPKWPALVLSSTLQRILSFVVDAEPAAPLTKKGAGAAAAWTSSYYLYHNTLSVECGPYHSPELTHLGNEDAKAKVMAGKGQSV